MGRRGSFCFAEIAGDGHRGRRGTVEVEAASCRPLMFFHTGTQLDAENCPPSIGIAKTHCVWVEISLVTGMVAG